MLRLKLLHRPTRSLVMTVVDEKYRCPLCGRTGNGGQMIDYINVPVCTGGDYSCVWFKTMDDDGQKCRSVAEVYTHSLSDIFVKKVDVTIIRHIAEYLPHRGYYR